MGSGSAMASGPNNGEQDRIGVGGGERTISVDGVSVIIKGNGESKGSLGDSMWDHDGAYDDDEVDHIGSGSGEGTNDPRGVNGVIVGDGETNGSLGDGVQERDGYQ